ncbi:hypothetical protein [Bradyrhizobium sp. ARR65]|uniref:hypothetical protein n=1 Tax=Bradyrhizobium sp. ARR65 TaxID=1040989 RepID=UPI00068691D9|nr:hypothetical protein [Bradyrhizobium sp. ARR65]
MSKTTNGAALMLTSLLINERPNTEFLLVAPSHLIAEISFRQVEGMIAADPRLSRREYTHVQPHLKKVSWLKTGATLQVKSFDPNVLTGVKPAGALVDELHVVSADANADRVIGQLRGGMISQPESFLLFITTQSERPPAGVFKAELDKARAIRDGKREGAMLPVLYEFRTTSRRTEKSGRIRLTGQWSCRTSAEISQSSGSRANSRRRKTSAKKSFAAGHRSTSMWRLDSRFGPIAGSAPTSGKSAQIGVSR